MAVMTPAQLAETRRKVAAGKDVVTWDKSTINAAIQAVEDHWESESAIRSGQINSATAPVTLDARIKDDIAAFWLQQKAVREGA